MFIIRIETNEEEFFYLKAENLTEMEDLMRNIWETNTSVEWISVKVVDES